MAHRFEITQDLEVGATPEQVWEAIATGRGPSATGRAATGRGMDSWFMGQSEVEPREGGRARWSIGAYTEDSTVSTWDPPRRFVNTGTEGPDGSFHRFDYRIEDRGSGRTTIRYVPRGLGIATSGVRYPRLLVVNRAPFQTVRRFGFMRQRR